MASMIGAATPALLANGIIGSTLTGLIRVPALLANAAAVMIAGEVVIRGLTNVLGCIGIQPRQNSWISTVAEKINEFGIRPYRNATPRNLVITLVAFVALSIVATELARLLGGAIPPIYNNVLTFFGPIRLDSAPFLDGVRALVGGCRLGF